MADNNPPASTNQEERTPHAGGRPLKYDTVEKLELAIQLYFDKCDPHIETRLEATGISGKGETMFAERKILTDQKPYTMSGLARALGIDRKTLLNYSNRDEFFPTVQDAKDRCQEYAETQLFGPYSNGAKFSLINNYRESPKSTDWADRHEVTGEDGKGLTQLVVIRSQEGSSQTDNNDATVAPNGE